MAHSVALRYTILAANATFFLGYEEDIPLVRDRLPGWRGNYSVNTGRRLTTYFTCYDFMDGAMFVA
jgi:hypothetical protein